MEEKTQRGVIEGSEVPKDSADKAKQGILAPKVWNCGELCLLHYDRIYRFVLWIPRPFGDSHRDRCLLSGVLGG